MEISYKLEHFEGPLDLLLHLIEKNKINIYDIPIVEITEQYLDYVNHMEKEDLNVVSEFLVMAATLLDIKARMLLPAEVDEETGEEQDPRSELVARLLEYKKYKYMALVLQDREDDAGLIFYKDPTVPKEVAKYEPPVDLDELLGDLTLARLQKIFEQVLKRQEDKIDRVRQFRRHPEGTGQPGRQNRVCYELCQKAQNVQFPADAGKADGSVGNRRNLSCDSGADEDWKNQPDPGAPV